MSWRNNFKPHIMERGLDYYSIDKVSSLKIEPDLVSAIVKGSEDYNVDAYFEGKRLIAMSCDCPYAADENFCKHMAAMMYAYENLNESLYNPPLDKSLEDYVLEADEAIVRSFLTKILREDSNLFKQFVVAGGEPITKLDMEHYSNELRGVFSDYLYPDGFIPYDEVWDFSTSLSQYMTNIIKDILIRNNYFKEAFKLTNQVFAELSELPIDDSGGVIIDIASECSEYWELILERCDIELKRHMFEWFYHEIETHSLDYLGEMIEEILWSQFQEDEFRERNRSFSRKRFEHYKNENHLSSKYYASKWAIYYLETLSEFEEVQTFCKGNLEYLEVREYYIDRLIVNKEFQEAILELEELKKAEKNFKSEYREKLMDLYWETKNKSAFLEELSYLVVHAGKNRMDLYERYKAQFDDEEWLEIRGPFIAEISIWSGQDIFLLQEKMYEELLKVAVKTKGLLVIRRYKNILYELDANKVLDKYEYEILEASKDTSGRKQYKRIAHTIGGLKQLSNSHPRVDELVSYLRKTYKRRSAMMEELSHL